MKKYLSLFLVVLAGIGLSGCSDVSTNVKDKAKEVGGTSNYEQDLTEENQARLLTNQPPVKIDWSLERENINKRTLLWNDPNKIAYIYLINYGKVMAFYTIKGKVSSVNSQITNPEQLTSRKVGRNMSDKVSLHDVDGVIASPAEDGSYGTNGDAIFFFDTNGVYYEWVGDYLLVDQPMKLSTPPEIIREIK